MTTLPQGDQKTRGKFAVLASTHGMKYVATQVIGKELALALRMRLTD
jgi:hypothetical protein